MSTLAFTVSASFVSSASVARDETITAIGSVHCDDGTPERKTFPLTGLRVELMDSDCDGSQICDDVMGTAYVGADGQFSVTGSGGDPFGGRPDVYLRFVYNDDSGVRLTDELNRSRSFSTPEHDHNNTASGTVDFGKWVTGLGVPFADGTHCRVWSNGHSVYQKYIAEIGSAPPAGHLDIEYWSAVWSGTAWSNTDTVHYPIHYRHSAMPHEFGHTVRHAADGSASHFAADVMAYRYARYHDRCAPDANAQPGEALASVSAYGFNEGWAHYWAGTVGGCPGTVSPDIEGEIAWALDGVQRNTNSTRKDMLQVLLSNPGTIHSMDDYMKAFGARIGRSGSALLSDARKRARQTIASQVPEPPYSETRRVQEIRTQISALDLIIRGLRSTGAASTVPSSTPAPGAGRRAGRAATALAVCQGDGCEDVFNAVVGPNLRAGHAAALEIYRNELVRASSSGWAEQVRGTLASGTFESWKREHESRIDSAVRAAMENALSRASESLIPIRNRLGQTYELFAKELADARARLTLPAGRAGGRGMANGRTEPFRPQVILPEDRAVRR